MLISTTFAHCWVLCLMFAVAVASNISKAVDVRLQAQNHEGKHRGCAQHDLPCLATGLAADMAVACPRRLSIGLVGAGVFARKAHVPSLTVGAVDCFDLRAVWSRTKASAEDLARMVTSSAPTTVGGGMLALWGHEGWQKLLSGPLGIETLDIVLPIPQQHQFVEDALRMGFAVISEKPVAPTSVRAEELLAIISASRLTDKPACWLVAENWRFEATFRLAALVRESGQIGQLAVFHGSSFGNIPPDHPMLQPGAWRVAKGNNWFADVVVHLVAGMRIAVGASLLVRGAAARQIRPFLEPFDTFSASMTAGDDGGPPGSMLFSLSSARQAPKEVTGLSDLELTLVGSNGSVVATRAWTELRGADGLSISRASSFGSPSVTFALRAAALEILSGCSSVDPASSVSPAEALRDLKLVEAILTSAKASAGSGQNERNEL